jgi:hypothetical protein
MVPPGFLSKRAIFQGQGGADSLSDSIYPETANPSRGGDAKPGASSDRGGPATEGGSSVRMKIVLRAFVAAAVALTLFPGSASAASRVEVSTGRGITWVYATVDTKAERVQIRILTPPRSDGRRLWHSCRFRSAVPGTYRCGIDTSAGSPARALKGRWLATLVVDGTRVASQRFTL